MNQFSAQEPSLGYHYQIRYALYLLLKAKEKEDPFIKLENLDDVEVGDLNRIELHQTKFHNSKAANLTDAGVDIWKTIRVWSEMVISDNIDLDNVLLVLVTTSETSPNSVLYELTGNKTGKKPIQEIIDRLNEVTQTSKSGKNPETKSSGLQSCFEAYNKLTNALKLKLVKAIYIRDNALNFDDLKLQIQSELQFTFLENQIETAFNDLEGWWYEQCIQHLQGYKNQISLSETKAYISYLNDKNKSDNLPIDSIIMSAEVAETDYSQMCFVRQLQEISLGKNAIKQSKRDYYRASEQRSKWIREHLLNPQEEIDYDFRLKDDWKGKFVFLQDDIENVADEIVKEKCRQFYKSYYGESYPTIFIRPRVTEIFLVKGSCQMLAEKQDIVWHPNYLKP
jgi:hypothetical protein